MAAPPRPDDGVRQIPLKTRLQNDVLKMPVAVAAIATLRDDPARRVETLEGIEHLLRAEIGDRWERRIRRIEAARFADKPALESFDFAFQTGIDRASVMDMATLNWVDRHEDLVLIGQGRHIAKAVAMIGCGQERSVRYTTCANMLAALHASPADGTLRTIHPELLVVDDLGYDPIEQEHAREAQLGWQGLHDRDIEPAGCGVRPRGPFVVGTPRALVSEYPGGSPWGRRRVWIRLGRATGGGPGRMQPSGADPRRRWHSSRAHVLLRAP